MSTEADGTPGHWVPPLPARELARDVLRRHGIATYPIRVGLIAQNEGTAVRLVYAPFHGALSRVGDGYLIAINRRLNLPRRRFVLAHELGHLLVGRLAAATGAGHRCTVRVSPGRPESFDEEAFCNAFARHVLIPEAVLGDLNEWGAISIEALAREAKRLEVSLKALVWRVLELVPCTTSPGALYFRRMGKPTNPDDIKWRLDWGVFPQTPPAARHPFLPRYDAVPDDSPIARAVERSIEVSRQQILQRASFRFGNLHVERPALVKAINQPGEAMALVLPDGVDYPAEVERYSRRLRGDSPPPLPELDL